ncbi:zinc finger BED domain-containing protein DAYSLEEPER-like [Nicotiana tomentosiformis]|uniref:zinc finger BED domain-containing protein DAYSLEEPER-like n=1 Tax=Nicotiana tomentosiformis TaxID=4098 RepID=UPI00388C8F4B
MGTNLMNGNHLHVRCMAHIMNLVVQDDLKESSVSIERVRHASLFSEYVKSGSKGVVLASSSDCSSLDTSTFGLSGSQVSTQNTRLLESLMQDIKKYKSGSGGVDTRTKLDKYFGEENEDDTKEFDVLLWWKLNSARFLILAEMARDVLDVPVSSVASECAFSMGGRLLDSFRTSLTPKLVQALVCLQDWLRNEKLK